MDDTLKFVMENWGLIVGFVGMLLVVLAALAELTPWKWDNKVIAIIRKVWSFIPVGGRNPAEMGTGRPEA